jgi:hypothetical protein
MVLVLLLVVVVLVAGLVLLLLLLLPFLLLLLVLLLRLRLRLRLVLGMGSVSLLAVLGRWLVMMLGTVWKGRGRWGVRKRRLGRGSCSLRGQRVGTVPADGCPEEMSGSMAKGVGAMTCVAGKR